MNYNSVTKQRIADMLAGIRIDTGTLTNTVSLIQNQVEIFRIRGRVMILQLFGEAITDFSATATQLLFNFTSSVPVITVQPLCAACTTMSGIKAGRRVFWKGGAVATNAVVTATTGISDVISVSPQVVGTIGGTGTVGILTSGANQTSGTCKFTMLYIPMSDGATVEALV